MLDCDAGRGFQFLEPIGNGRGTIDTEKIPEIRNARQRIFQEHQFRIDRILNIRERGVVELVPVSGRTGTEIPQEIKYLLVGPVLVAAAEIGPIQIRYESKVGFIEEVCKTEQLLAGFLKIINRQLVRTLAKLAGILLI